MKNSRTQKTQKALDKKLNQKNERVVRIATRQGAQLITTIGFQIEGFVSDKKIWKNLSGDQKSLKEHLGGKGAGLVMISRLGIPVPPAFNLATPLCHSFLAQQRLPQWVLDKTHVAIKSLGKKLGKSFGSATHPLLVSVRSGARVSMPGMMDTILNLGLNREITEALAHKNPDQARFWWDCYRRLLHMFATVVLRLDHDIFEDHLDAVKKLQNVSDDTDLTSESLKKVCGLYETSLIEMDRTFPSDPMHQLTLAVEAVFRSWNTDRAVHYRRLHQLSDDWGTAVTVQAMVFGNWNDQSATGVVFTRDPSTGKKEPYGEYLLNAQGEDVVAGIRTPRPIADLKKAIPKSYGKLMKAIQILENYSREVQDVEFTIEDDELFILQTRTAKRTASAAFEHWYQLVSEKKITRSEVLSRIGYDQVKQLLHPSLKVTKEIPLVAGLPASPGAVSGRIYLDPEAAVAASQSGQAVILVRKETSPEDIMGMAVAEGVLTATGGMTSHAAVVARGMGKSCIVGCADIDIHLSERVVHLGSKKFTEGDWITLDGSTGRVFEGVLATEPVRWSDSARSIFDWADDFASTQVLANADTEEQAKLARDLGAQGIGLCRTEHMFFDKDRIHQFRLMILSDDSAAIQKLSIYQEDDFLKIFSAMKNLSVCVRLLDPPLHEFLPREQNIQEINLLAHDLDWSVDKLKNRIAQLHEVNPMLGHRGCRLGITAPGLYEMQVRALARAMVRLWNTNERVTLKIMIPLIMNHPELKKLVGLLKTTFSDELERQFSDSGVQKKILKCVKWGTMIELPRACLVADELASLVDFFSFGTNDLTQTTLGLSRDDSARFIPEYIANGLLKSDPFESLDIDGVGQLIEMAVEKARSVHRSIDIGICGEHGGDPQSIRFFKSLDFDSVSCSPFRVPVARLALAKAELELKVKGKKI